MNPNTEAKTSHTGFPRAAGALVALALAASAGYLEITGDSAGGTPQRAGAASAPAERPQGVGQGENRVTTLGDLWRLIRAPKASESGRPARPSNAVDDEHPFTIRAVRESLRNVRLDANGDVILDDRARQALNRSLEYGRLPLDELALAELQALIRERLPGKAGEQTAEVVGDYYRYLQAEEQYMSTTGEAPAADKAIATHEARYRRLRQLRAQYLGPDAARQLFRTSDANAAYMFRAHRIQLDPDLSEEEKLAKVDALHAELQHAYIHIDNWDERHARFQAEKARILRAGLSEADKRAQVGELLRQAFRPEELEQIEHLHLGDI
ncbi:hypothetical protein H0Z60_07440 [Ectothiorhodospiraceae bacterium WFHF3C12]|nr:hypothetical protein [Ectothiorhodospiraceae bacterium WFHF3C12]